MKIVIVGGGPVGCFTGYLFAKAGHDVSIYENHGKIGAPIQCTGILTSSFDQFEFLMDDFLVNTIDTIEVYSPNKKLRVKQKDYIVCRTKFDQYFAKIAEKEGANIYLNHAFVRKEGDELIIVHEGQEKKVTCDVVIAADGPLSTTAKAFGLYHKGRENYYGIQAVMEGNFEPHVIKTYFGNDVCPGLFAWVCPENASVARVGLAMKKNSRAFFEKFVEGRGWKVTQMQAGTIPLYHPQQKIRKGNCYVVGDASSYVKATTLGGIVPAFKQVEIVVDCILNNKDIEKEMKPVRQQMWTHLQVQKIMEKFSDKDWDRLIGYVAQPKIQKVFEKYTRDNPIPLITSVLLKEPRFLRFVRYLV
ncbi:NAD(P)/FAD-dependent oxidoreductase [Candidatus Woesearchaeota archaeon]|nr:NAD(P)/FAD-dependent oxidoreductase [Candidatus Woesearchaeota archaeon]